MRARASGPLRGNPDEAISMSVRQAIASGGGGRPRQVEFNRRIAEKGAVEGLSGDEWFFLQIAGGRSLSEAMGQFGMSRAWFYTWLKEAPEQRRALYAEAKRMSAEAIADEAGEVLDDLASNPLATPTAVALATARSRYKQWLASKRDPEQFGERQAAVNVQLNVGALHLDALRQVGRVPAEQSKVLLAEVVGEVVGEVVEEGGAG